MICNGECVCGGGGGAGGCWQGLQLTINFITVYYVCLFFLMQSIYRFSL